MIRNNRLNVSRFSLHSCINAKNRFKQIITRFFNKNPTRYLPCRLYLNELGKIAMLKSLEKINPLFSALILLQLERTFIIQNVLNVSAIL